MKNTEYKKLSHKMTKWASSSILIYSIFYMLAEQAPKYFLVDVIMLFIFPISCLLFLLYKYFDLKQTSKLNLTKIFIWIGGVILLFGVTLI